MDMFTMNIKTYCVLLYCLQVYNEYVMLYVLVFGSAVFNFQVWSLLAALGPYINSFFFQNGDTVSGRVGGAGWVGGAPCPSMKSSIGHCCNVGIMLCLEFMHHEIWYQ